MGLFVTQSLGEKSFSDESLEMLIYEGNNKFLEDSLILHSLSE